MSVKPAYSRSAEGMHNSRRQAGLSISRSADLYLVSSETSKRCSGVTHVTGPVPYKLTNCTQHPLSPCLLPPLSNKYNALWSDVLFSGEGPLTSACVTSCIAYTVCERVPSLQAKSSLCPAKSSLFPHEVYSNMHRGKLTRKRLKRLW